MLRLLLTMAVFALALLAGAASAADDKRVEACRIAAGSIGVVVDPGTAGQSDNQVSFAVAPQGPEGKSGLTCVFDPASDVPQLTDFYWRYLSGGNGKIETALANILLQRHFSSPPAQQAQMQAYQDGQQADFAFQCAAWANVDDGRSIDPSEAGRLSLYGYGLSLSASSLLHGPEAVAQAKGYGPLYQRAPADFWVGVAWELALQAVNRGLDYNVPQGDHPFKDWQELRAANASANFTKQGCAALGQK